MFFMQKSNSTKKLTIDKNIIKGAITGLAFLLLSVPISAAVILKTMTNEQYYLPVLLVCIVLSGFLSGFTSTVKQKRKGVINGISASILPAVTAFAAVSIASNTINPINILVPLITIVSGALGGITATNIRVKRKRR